MLTAEQLDVLADPIIDLYREFEMTVIRDIARRLAKMGKVTPTAQWQMQRIAQSGMVYDDAIKELAKITGKSEAELRRAFKTAGVKALRFDDAIYRAAGLSPLPLNLSPQMTQVLLAGLQKTNGTMRNLTMTTALDAQQKFIRAADVAYLQVTSGTMSPDQAIRAAIKELGGSGLEIVYPNGHRDKLDVAMRRAVITGVNQTVGRMQVARADELGQDLVAVSAHIGARNQGDGPANHESWQGKVYSRSGNHPKYPSFVEKTGYGTIEGLCGVNCRHSFYPFFEGISENAYTQAQLKSFAGKTVTYNGQSMSVYEATQVQRSIERKIRAWKRQAVGLEAAGLDNTFELVKVRAWQGRMRKFVDQTGLSRQYVRESVIKGTIPTVTAPPPEPTPPPAPVEPPIVPAAPTGPQPTGTPVTEALETSGIRSPQVREQVDLALGAIDQVHGDGALPRIPIGESSGRRTFGTFYSSGITPLRIAVSKNGNHQALTTLHEIGHFIDHRGFGMRNVWATRFEDLGGKIVEAARGTSWYKNIWKKVSELNLRSVSGDMPAIVIDHKYVRYLISSRELWARAYAQYIATKSGNPELLRQLKSQQAADFPIQWDDSDFQAILEAFDSLFTAMGWIG